jgi:protein subunit release factor B
LPGEAEEAAKKANFDLQGHQIKAMLQEQTRAPRLVRIGAIQNAIQKPTTAPVIEQVRMKKLSFLASEPGSRLNFS